MASFIPMRPKGQKFNLTAEEMDGLTYYLLSGCAREEVFLKFMRPDFIGSKANSAVKAAVSQFFATKEVKDYLAAYKKTLEDFLSEKTRPKADKAGTLEERKARARTRATEFAMSLAENIEHADDPETVLKLMDKVGLLDGDEEIEEVPRRYIPITCGECEYRKFVEENCEKVEDGTEIAEE